MVVEDRKVRAEHAEARREYILQNGDTGLSIGSGSVILSRAGGGAISKEAAHALLSGYGPIAEMQPTTHADANLHGIPEGMWVKFAFYLDFKDALKVRMDLELLQCCSQVLGIQQHQFPVQNYGATKS